MPRLRGGENEKPDLVEGLCGSPRQGLVELQFDLIIVVDGDSGVHPGGCFHGLSVLFCTTIIHFADLSNGVATEIDRTMVTSQSVNRANGSTLKDEQKRALQKLWGKTFEHRWQIEKALAELSPEWRMKPGDKE